MSHHIQNEMPNTSENRFKRKLPYIELIRIFAILLVIYTHGGLRSTYAYLQYWPASGLCDEIQVFLWACMYHICRVAVPLFLMISGALLLAKKESVLELYKRRVSRFLSLILLFIPVAYLVYFPILKGADIPSITELIQLTLSFNLTPEIMGPFVTLWFLYIYLAFLILLPLLRAMVASMDRNLYWYLIFCTLAVHVIIPVMLFVISGTPRSLYINRFLVLCENVVFFPVLGYFLERILPLSFWSRGKLAGLTIISILSVVVAVSCTLSEQREMTQGAPATSFLSVPIIPLCMLFYVLAKKLFVRWTPSSRGCSRRKPPPTLPDILQVLIAGAINGFLCALGRLSFAIYILESTVRLRVVLPGLDYLSGCRFPPFVECSLLVLGTYAISACLAYVLLKIPYMGKLF